MRIFYLVPDLRRKLNYKTVVRNLAKANFYCLFRYLQTIMRSDRRPVGSIKTIFQHCEILNELGLCARPVFLARHDIKWFNTKIEPVYMKDVVGEFRTSDIIVCPEVIPYEAIKFKNAHKIILVLNWIGVTPQRRYLRASDMSASFLKMGYENIVTTSMYSQKILRDTGKGEAVIIPNYIDHTRLRCAYDNKKENSIMWVPRKNCQDGLKIIRKVKKKAPQAKFTACHNMKESRILDEYKKADIFLATGYPEGFGRPPLEAMACGAAVAGFSGGGADEFMIDGKTALVARDGDCDAAAVKIIELLNNKELKEKIRICGHMKSKEYNKERTKKALKEFYENFVGSV